jgi:hypothetical protein
MAHRRRRLHRILRTGFVLAFALTLVFAIRLTLSAVHWSDPDSRDAPIEGWMPLGYVARSWEIPRDVLAESLNLDPGTQPRRNLEQIAEDRGVPLETLVEVLRQAIAAHREAADD